MPLLHSKHPSAVWNSLTDISASRIINAGTTYTDAFQLNPEDRAELAISCEVDELHGFAVAGETLDLQLQEAPHSNGPWQDVSGKTSTQLLGTATLPALRTIKIQSSEATSPLLPYARIKMVAAAQPVAKAITSFAFATPIVTLAVTDGDEDNVFVGDSIIIASSTSPANDGTFVVTAVDAGANTISYSNAAGVAEAGGSATFAFAASSYGFKSKIIAHTSGA